MSRWRRPGSFVVNNVATTTSITTSATTISTTQSIQMNLLVALSPIEVARRLLAVVRMTLSFPASVTRHYMSLLLSAVLYVFVNILRIQPAGYIRVGKVVELQKVIDHLHAQVELYRGVVRELKDDMSQKESDRKMALKRLKTTKEEIKVLNEKLYAGEEEAHDREGASVIRESSQSQHLVGFSFLVVVSAVVLFQAYVVGSVFEWKVVMSVGFPLVWMYFQQGGGVENGGRGGSKGSVLLCGMWWLVGFLSGAWVARLEAA